MNRFLSNVGRFTAVGVVLVVACGGTESGSGDSVADPDAPGVASGESGGATEGPGSMLGENAAEPDPIVPSSAGSSTASVPGDTTAEAEAPPQCTVTPSIVLSEAIQTVGIVTFATSSATVDEAHIEFGLDVGYGMTAPVDVNEPEYRTLLLGMKQDREYHYRVVVNGPDGTCVSEDQTFTTGFLMNGLAPIEVTTLDAEGASDGFFLTGQYQAMGGPNSPAYIIDQDGDYVWAIALGNYVTGVRMSYDGKFMWINGTDNTTGGEAAIHRVSMDGLMDEDLSEQFGLQDHSITVLPDESVIFYGHDLEGCANIRRHYLDGTIDAIINSFDAHGAEGMCHVNHVEYSPEDQSFVFSDDNHDNYTKVTLEGEVVWVLGGVTSHFTGDVEWERQHGVDLLGPDRLVFFNNGSDGGFGPNAAPREDSIAIELQLDLTNMTATRSWVYMSDPPIKNSQLGDVQRLPNGNTMVAYSTQGILHEVTPGGDVVREMLWPLGGAYGYTIYRSSLYGPPPR